jgi:hypothetical protein
MKNLITGFLLILILSSCRNPTSPNLHSTEEGTLEVDGTGIPKLIQVGRTYLALDPTIWNVEDGRYSFKKATVYGQIIDTVNHTPGPKLLYKDKFVHISDRDSLGRYYKYTSDDGIKRTSSTRTTFDPYIGYYPRIIHGGISTQDGYIYLIAFLDKEEVRNVDWTASHTLLIYKNTSPNNFSNFRLVNTHYIDGAVDSWHSLVYNKDTQKYYIYGRKRTARDWGEYPSSNQFLRLAMPDRRGVRILEADNIEGSWRELSPIDPINYQPEYTNPNHDIRMDYYGGSASYYYGNILMQINTFFKDKRRVPSTRPERVSGTGPLYPTLWHSTDGKDFNPTHPAMTRSLVTLSMHERDWSKYFKETDGYFEVGQIYSAPLMVRDTLVYMFYRNRWDTHYLPHPQQPPSENWASYIVLDRFSSFQPLDVSCTSIPYYKQTVISDNKCLPATITTKVLEKPEDATAVGINVEGNFTLRVFNQNMELIDEIVDITTDQVSYVFKPDPKYGGLPDKAIIQIELYKGDFYALKFFK